MQCEICEDFGWVCENHPNLTAFHSDDCGGAGDPCSFCNPNADHRFTEIIAEVE
jgi:hypothetical protein